MRHFSDIDDNPIIEAGDRLSKSETGDKVTVCYVTDNFITIQTY